MWLVKLTVNHYLQNLKQSQSYDWLQSVRKVYSPGPYFFFEIHKISSWCLVVMMHSETLNKIDPIQFNFQAREFSYALKSIKSWGGLPLPEQPLLDWKPLLGHIANLGPDEGKAVLCCLYYGLQGDLQEGLR